jgi:hypothetical protein
MWRLLECGCVFLFGLRHDGDKLCVVELVAVVLAVGHLNGDRGAAMFIVALNAGEGWTRLVSLARFGNDRWGKRGPCTGFPRLVALHGRVVAPQKD